jgi:hydroxylamine reductase (hybrid-cluster protein)
MAEKSIDELKAELDMLTKQNYERQIAVEKAKLEADMLKVKEEEEHKLRDKIREEEHSKILTELSGISKVSKEAPENLKSNSRLVQLKQNMVQKYPGYTGKTYEERIIDLVDKGIKWVEGGK